MRAYAVTRFHLAPPPDDRVQWQTGLVFVYIKDFGRVEFNAADCSGKANEDLINIARSFFVLEG